MNVRPRTPSRRCPVCSAEELLTVTVTVAGADIEFTACNVCERRWWERDGETVALSAVLSLASKR